MLTRLLHGSIRKKLAILFVFSALPSILIILLNSLQNSVEATRNAEQELLHFSQQLAETQGKTTRDIKLMLESLARQPEVRDANPEACTRLFENVLKINTLIGAIHLVDTQGELIASGSARKPANFAHTRHFRDAVGTRAFASGEYLVGVTLKVPVFAFGQPVLDQAGNVQGVLLTSLRLDRYGELFRDARFPAESFIGVTDRNGIRLFRYPDGPGNAVGVPIDGAVFDRARTGKPEGLIETTDPKGLDRIYAYQQLRLDTEQQPYMYFFVAEPRASVYAGVQVRILEDLSILFLAIGLTLVSGWYLGGRTVGLRFEEMALAAKRIGGGDLSARVSPAPDIAELDVLSRAFNAMAEALSEDINRRAKAEEDLRASENRLKIIFEKSPLGMILFDSDGTIVDCNTPFVELMGSSREKLIGFCTARKSTPRMRETIKKALAGEAAVFEGEYTSVTGGLSKTLRVVFNPITPGVSPTGLIATLEDIGERKQGEKALQESEARFRKLFEQVPSVAVQGYAADATTLYWNAASESLYGYTAAEAVGRSLLDLIIPPEMREEVRLAVKSMTETGQAIPAGELSLMRKDGTRVNVFSSHAIVEKPGSPPELFCIDIDLTMRKQAEDALIRAKEDAEAANRAKSEFLANMSHEIRTPINGVLGMLQLMETTSLDDEQRQYVQLASGSVKRLNILLSDILDLSRVEAGKVEIREAEFSLRGLSESVLDLFAVTARSKGLELACTLAPDLPDTLVGDEMRVRQVLFNLVGNALKFTDRGRIDVEIASLQELPGKRRQVLFTVRDTGIGIPADRIRDIFEPFRQVESSYTRNYQGAGLGLAIVQRLVKLMGGNVDIDSTPGKGTTFRIVLPLGIGAEATRPSPAQDSSPESRGNLRILLVEDEPSNQLPPQKFLEKAGHSVTVAENGKKALDLLRTTEFDCVLMDIQMPVMDGTETTRIIRASKDLGRNRDVPVIALTAYAMSGDREKFLAQGMNGYVSKPVVMAELMRAIDEATRQRRS